MTTAEDDPTTGETSASAPRNSDDSDALRQTLAALGVGVLRVDATGVVLWADAGAEKLLEHAFLRVDDEPGRRRLMVYGRAGQPPWQEAIAHGSVPGLQYEIRAADEQRVPVLIDATKDEGSRDLEVVLLVRRATAATPSNDLYRAVFDEVGDGIVVQDVETGAIVDNNRRAAELFKYGNLAPPVRPHETTDKPATEADAQAATLMRRAAAGEPQVFEWPALDREGRKMNIEVSLKRARIGLTDRLLGVIRDITPRKRTEQELRASQERYRAIIQASHDITWALDAQACFTFVNKRAEDLTGYSFSEWRGKSFVPLIHPEDLAKSKDAFVRTMAGESVHYSVRVKDVRGRIRQLQANLEPLWEDGQIIGMVGLGTDITERNRMEDELHKAQKLESLGLLAGGIAHDFNNILTAIVGGVTLAKRSTGSPEQQRETLEMAEKACLRARELTQQLLTFSRGGAPVRKPGSIAELLHETARFALRGSNVRCEISLDEDLHIVEMDSGQMSQVVNNLLINAAQAMPKGGTVGLTAANVRVERTDGTRPQLSPGCYVRISVKDEGDGIPDEHLPNIFDPYFTTKPAGTGLGLATCYSIVRRHEGYIDVETHPGVGTTFHIYLPSTERTFTLSEEPPVPESKRGGTVLLMDDDDMVREVGAEMLQMLGFGVDLVDDGQAAIDKYREVLEAGSRFDAVILDLTVPGGMGGREAAAILRELDPSAKLLASSGYSTDPVMADHAKYGFDGVIAKPYVPEDLDRAIGSVFRVK